MTSDTPASPAMQMPPDAEVSRAIRYTYGQVMLGSVFAASTGGMFLVGFAMKLGAGDTLLGLMTALPQGFVVFQFLGAYFVERGISRKRLTFSFGLLPPMAWLLIAAIPLIGTDAARAHLGLDDPGTLKTVQFAILIGILALVAAANQCSGSARGSWIGELIPERRRAAFFGHAAMFGGLIAALFAVGEGRFLDFVNAQGLTAFTALFLFGVVFGLASVFLTLPQPDCPLPREASRPSMLEVARRTIRNRPFRTLALTHALWSMTAISAPFGPAYLLRDVGVSYFGLGILNALWMLAWLASSPFWGRVVNRFGCRPVIKIGFLMWAPCCLIWLAIPPGATARAYWLLPWTNVIAGIGIAGVSVAISTFVYKSSQPVGRSVQFAMYNVFVVLAGAPMPLLGGWAVDALRAAGYAVDLRLTFFAVMFFALAAAGAASFIEEPDAARARSLAFRHFPGLAVSIVGAGASAIPFLGSMRRFELPIVELEERDAERQEEDGGTRS